MDGHVFPYPLCEGEEREGGTHCQTTLHEMLSSNLSHSIRATAVRQALQRQSEMMAVATYIRGVGFA